VVLRDAADAVAAPIRLFAPKTKNRAITGRKRFNCKSILLPLEGKSNQSESARGIGI